MLPFYSAVRIKEKLSTISNIVGVLGAITLCAGILFKIMHWSWADNSMNLGGILIVPQ